MNNNQMNTIAGWVLAAMVCVLGLSILTGAMFTPAKLESPAFVVQGVEQEGEAAGGGAAAAEPPIAALLASADIAKGANQFKKCAACHTIDKGAAAGIGPNLYGILGLHHAHAAGFGYSDAMKGSSDKVWDWETLSQWVKSPKAFLPGNKMSFAGMSKPQDRADLLAFLNSKSDNPLPLPAAPEAAAPDADDAAAPAAAPANAAPAETPVAAPHA